MPVPVSVLDLATVRPGGSAAETFDASVALAQDAERWGYRRYWFAEHHNMPTIASSATAVLIGYIAGRTSTIRVGAGGIMLPNHSPLVIAEQFGTLETLYPGRIDLGLGRAPGGDMAMLQALRRHPTDSDRFPQDVVELQALLGPERPGQTVRATPGTGTEVPLVILGSSLFGAKLAAALGLPYSFASHFAPAALMSALEVYRRGFQPSPLTGGLDAPRTMAGANVMVADTQAEAERQFTSVLERFRSIVTNRRSGLLPPADATPDELLASWSPAERAAVAEMTRISFVGTPGQVREDLEVFTKATGVDEVIVTCGAFDPEIRKRSLELLADVWS